MHRKMLPLALMYAGNEEGIEGRTRLQKLIFLMQQESEGEISESLNEDYEFVPYDYGPFSKEVYQDLDSMSGELVRTKKERTADGNTKYSYRLTEEGQKFVEDNLTKREGEQIMDWAKALRNQYEDVYLSDLIEEVYSKYPQFAKNSIY
jgi:uncharacterized protein YwgA